MDGTSIVRIQTRVGDLTEERTDAIVNAANTSLVRWGGVWGAIFAKAGPKLNASCTALGGCPVGQARLTPAFGIPIRGIIHAVGPRHGDESGREARLLAAALRSSLDLADCSGFRSIAFPSISTGIYGYPLVDAAKVVALELKEYVVWQSTNGGSLELIRIVLRDDETRSIYDRAIENAMSADRM